MGSSLLKKLFEKAGKEFTLREGYGLTELSSASHLLPPESASEKLGSAGVPVPSTLTKIISTVTGEPLGRNQQGEICIKGLQVSLP